MSGPLLDAFARPAVYLGGGSGALYAPTEADSRLRPAGFWHFSDYISLLSTGRWKILLSNARSIATKGIVSAAIEQKADYVSASGWRPYFMGEDSDWGEEAEEFLENTACCCTTRGPRFNWRTVWRMTVRARAGDGGLFFLKTRATNGLGLIQPLEAHRIGQRGASGEVGPDDARAIRRLDDGTFETIMTPYVGLKIVNGIIYNKAGAEVAYRVLGPGPEEDEDISANDMVHIGAPRWYSEGRPLPEIAPALLDLMGVDLARSAQLDQQIIDSKITVLEKNDTGTRNTSRDLVNPPWTNPTLTGTAPDVIERGHMRFIKKGGDFEAWSSSRPSDQWMNFDLRTLSAAIAAIGWRQEMLDPSELGGVNGRAFQDQINTTIQNSFVDAEWAAVDCVRHRVACAIDAGVLRPSEEFLKWGITAPPDFVVDRNSAKVDVELVKAGADSMPHVHRRAGMRSRQVVVSQAKYRKMVKEVAAEFGVEEQELGDLSVPGDAQSQKGADGENSDQNSPKKQDKTK